MCCREFASCETVHSERSDSNLLGAALLQSGQCAADCRTGVDDVVDDRHPFALKLTLEGLWDRVRDRKQARRPVVSYRLRVGKGQVERRCDHEAHECALNEGPTHCRNVMPAETVRKRFRQWLYAFRAQKKKLQI
jgi:hypothetical protein